MQIFRYKADAMRPRLLFLFATVALFVVPVTWMLRVNPGPEEERWWESFLVFFLWMFVLMVAYYDLALWRITGSAMFTLDEHSIGYHDRYLNTTLAWSDLVEMTPTFLRGESGRVIHYRPGLDTIERSDEFVEAIVKNAGLAVVPRGSGRARFWAKTPSHVRKAA